MKIFILPVINKLQPVSQQLEYPVGNDDYGVEQDFLKYLKSKPSLLTTSPSDADWHYLPAFWTRWHLNHNYGKEGVKELQQFVDQAVIDSKKTFTICQYDDGPVVKLKGTKIFLASRKSKQGVDIPLLRNLHKVPVLKPKKKYLVSFVGRVITHPIRLKMTAFLIDYPGAYISDGDNGQKFFIDTTLRSYAALCPRGYGGSSFRFFEAMQLGVVPIMVSDKDTRPFREFINWDDFSFFVNNPAELPKLLASLDKKTLVAMGKKARKFYLNDLQYSKWCKYVIKELEVLD